ncbi:hypothetical protein ACFY04_15755 [Streptomyces sp. NPDC001549]|uniref:hypothetical protein n=1 Tax=Streptomyces sp. NPDC001549 TaxID=3364586 RepID=UPI00369B6FE9
MLDSNDNKAIQTTRAWAGLLVVLFGDIGIALAAILVALHLKTGSEAVAILTSAFTAITAMTSAYFGIRAAANTAQSAVSAGVQSGGGQGAQGGQGDGQ